MLMLTNYLGVPVDFDSYIVHYRCVSEFVSLIVFDNADDKKTFAVQEPSVLFKRRDGLLTIRANDSRNTRTFSPIEKRIVGFKTNGSTVTLHENVKPEPVVSPVTLSGISLEVWNGVSFLDQHRPGWENEINLDKLELASTDECILGQLVGDYHVAKGLYNLSSTDCFVHGFATLDSRRVTNEWRRIIEYRRSLV
jgi:hypothetical protein